MAELLIIGGIFAGIIESAIVKRYKEKYEKGGFLFTAFLTLFAMIFFVVTDKNGFGVPSLIWKYAIPSGICYAVAYFCTFIAFGCGPFALSCLIISYSLVATIVYGIVVRGEEASMLTYIGIILILASLYFVNSGKKSENEKAVSLKWAVNIFIVLAGNVIFAIIRLVQLDKYNSAYNNDFMIASLFVAVILLVVAGLIKEHKDLGYILRYGAPFGALAGILNGTHNAFSMIVVSLMNISVSGPLSSGLKTVITFLFAMLVYKEKYTKKQLIGVLMGLVAIILLKL